MRSAESATVITGVESLSCLATIGGSVPSGSLRITPCTRSRTSCAASSTSRSSSKVAITTELPALETERSSRMPCTVLTASSMLLGDLRLDVLGRAAGQRGAHHHRRQVDRRESDRRRDSSRRRAPTTTSARTSIAANIGRRMQISASFCTGC